MAVTLPFLDRVAETARLCKALTPRGGAFAVVYGRRRCGKSTLLQHVLKPRDVYFVADEGARELQLQSLASEIARTVPEFDAARYSSWESLLAAARARIPRGTTVVFDEFPYLVQQAPHLPSVLQNLLDKGLPFNLVLCGSSQRMVQGLILDARAPLYGRAHEIIPVRPLECGWITAALGVHGAAAVEAYSVWGGVPRYWELAADAGSHVEAVKRLVLDAHGVLHQEPYRLLLDDLRSASLPYSVLSAIAAGCHRLSEIAGRLGKTAVQLSRTLENLIDLNLIRREYPFGESQRTTKRTLYCLDDPFLLFWYRFVLPNRSVLARGLTEEVFAELEPRLAAHQAEVWESLARLSTAALRLGGIAWKPAQRWWGRTPAGAPCEIDLVAESFDGSALLIGEAKWRARTNPEEVLARLAAVAAGMPWTQGKKVVLACWQKGTVRRRTRALHCVTPDMVLGALR